MASADAISVSPQAATAFFTFPKAAKIWGSHLSYAVGANSAYAAGNSQFYARVKTQSGFIMCTIELAVSDASQDPNGDGDPTFPGVPVAAGDKLQLDVNNGVTVAGVVQRASVVVFYSIP